MWVGAKNEWYDCTSKNIKTPGVWSEFYKFVVRPMEYEFPEKIVVPTPYVQTYKPKEYPSNMKVTEIKNGTETTILVQRIKDETDDEKSPM